MTNKVKLTFDLTPRQWGMVVTSLKYCSKLLKEKRLKNLSKLIEKEYKRGC